MPLRSFLSVVVTATGAAALLEEVLWARMLHRLLGGTALSVATVLAGFLGGIAVGGLIANALRARIGRPLAALGVVELVAGAAAVVFTLVLRGAGPLAALDVGPAALLGLAVLFTVPLGASFPVLVAFLERSGGGGRDISLLYGLNALGGAAGAVVAGFIAIPLLGETWTIHLAAALQVAAGLAILAVARKRREASDAGDSVVEAPGDLEPGPAETMSSPSIAASAALHLVVLVSGLTAFYWEVLWSRILVLVIGSTVYAFAIVTAGVLAGIGAGSIVFRGRERGGGFTTLPLALAWLLVPAFFVVPYLPDVYLFGVRTLGAAPHIWGVAGAGMVVLVPAFLVGALFPWAVARAPASCGSMVAVNALGAGLGAYLGGPLGAALLDLESGFELGVALAGALALCGLLATPPRERRVSRAPVAVAAVAALLVVWIPGGWDLRRLLSGVYQWPPDYLADPERTPESMTRTRDLLVLDQGREVIVTVERNRPSNTIEVKGNGKTEGSVPAERASPHAASLPNQVLLGAYPALLRPGASAAVIGLGSGVTVGAAHRFGLGPLVVLEIEGGFRRAIEHPAVHGAFAPYLAGALEAPGTRLEVGDARRLLLGRLRDERWSVIIGQPSEPWTSGSASLFTREFFALAADRLEEAGMFVQWMPLYKIDLESLRLLVRTFRSVFSRVFVVRPPATGGLILIGSRRPIDLDALLEPLAPEELDALAEVGVAGGLDLVALVVLGPDGVDRWVGTGPRLPLNTDARNALEFRGPLLLHSGLDLTRANLRALRERGGEDPLTRSMPAIRRSAELRRQLAARNAHFGDFPEALAILEGDDSAAADALRREIEAERRRERAPAAKTGEEP